MISTLTKESLQTAATSLAATDPDLRRALEIGGAPRLWKRTATYSTFIRIILEQQVSLASAWNTYERLANLCEKKRVTPIAVQTLGTDRLKDIGFSRQKARYTSVLADQCLSGRFKIAGLGRLPDDEVRARIVAQLGMGDWTADMFLLLALCRSDIFPIGDLAVVNGFRSLTDQPDRDREQIIERAEAWRPHRAVATRMIWNYYLHIRGSKLPR